MIQQIGDMTIVQLEDAPEPLNALTFVIGPHDEPGPWKVVVVNEEFPNVLDVYVDQIPQTDRWLAGFLMAAKELREEKP